MPFKSGAQRKFLFAKKPAVAAKFAADEKEGKAAPKKKKFKMAGASRGGY